MAPKAAPVSRRPSGFRSITMLEAHLGFQGASRLGVATTLLLPTDRATASLPFRSTMDLHLSREGLNFITMTDLYPRPMA